MDREHAKRILSPMPFDQGFHFYFDIGRYTGRTAVSMSELIDVIGEIDGKVLEFHVRLRDFEKWFRWLGDEVLAEGLSKISQDGYTGETLRERLLHLLRKRREDLTKQL